MAMATRGDAADGPDREPGSGRVNLLDLLDELLHLPPESRAGRLGELSPHLGDADRAELERWLAHHRDRAPGDPGATAADVLAAGPPDAVVGAMRLLDGAAPDAANSADGAAVAGPPDSFRAALDGAAGLLAGPTVDGGPTAAAAALGLREGPGTVIGHYKLLEQVGEGGMGVVFMAEQQEPVRRRVAVKVIKPGMDTRQVVARFEAERQALALMDHPNIAKVLDGGSTESGRPYFAMELVRGTPITDYCDKHRLTTRERLGLFVQVCQAVQHAHSKGVIHRDLKPSNVLVTVQDGKPVPKVIDFGIAKATQSRLTDKTLFTEFRQLIGTPEYMSPEQAESDAAVDVDTRSDVYSLGVLLYALLTGSTPFEPQQLRSAAYAEIRRIIRDMEPPRPSTRLSTMVGEALSTIAARRGTEPKRLGQLLRGELDWVVMKALEKDRDRRYETASALARDVERYLADDAVEACPPSLGYRLRKLARRHRGPLRAAAAFVLLLSVATTVSIWQAVRAMADRDRAETAEEQIGRERDAVAVQKKRADEQKRVADEQRKAAEVQTARSLVSEGRALRAVASWGDAADRYKQADALLRRIGESTFQAELGLWETAGNIPLLNTFSDRATNLASAAILPDGRTAVTGGNDGVVRLWDLVTGCERRVMRGHAGPVYCVAASPDGRALVSGGGDGLLRVWDADSGAERRVFRGHGSAAVRVVAVLPDGERVISGGDDGVLRVWETQTARGRVLDASTGVEIPVSNSIRSLCLSRDGGTAVSGDGVGRVRVWDVESGALVRSMLGFINPVTSVALSDDEGTIFAGAGGIGHYIVAWNRQDGLQLGAWQAHAGPVASLVTRPGSGQLLSASPDKTLKLWPTDPEMPQLQFSYGDQSGSINAAGFTPDGSMLLSAGDHLRLWRITTSAEVRRLVKRDRFMFGVALSPDGRLAMSGGDTRLGSSVPGPTAVLVWDVATGRMLRAFHGHEGPVWCTAFSPDGSQVLSASEDGSVRLWDLATGKQLRKFDGHAGAVRTVAFCGAGRAVSAGDDKTLRLWGLDDGRRIATLKGHAAPVLCVAAAGDGGAAAASGDAGGTLGLWRLASDDAAPGSPTVRWLRGRPGRKATGVAFSPDGRRLVAGYSDGGAELWDAADGVRIHTIPTAHAGGVTAVAFWPDGLKVVTGGADYTLAVWDAGSGRELHRFENAQTNSIAVSADGKLLLSGGMGRALEIRDLDRSAQCRAMGPELAAARDRLQHDPKDPEALAVFGRWYALNGVYDWAAELLAAAREGGSDVSPLLLARCYRMGSDARLARRESRIALEKGEAPEAYLRLWLEHFAQRPFGPDPAPVPGLVWAMDFDRGIEGEAYHDAGPEGVRAALGRRGDDLWPPIDAGRTSAAVWGASGEWLAYTVDVAEDGAYDIHAGVYASAGGNSLHIEFDGVDKTGPMRARGAAGTSPWQTVTKRGVRLKAGRQTMRVCFDSGAAGKTPAPEGGAASDLDWIAVCPEGDPAPVTAAEVFAGTHWIWYPESGGPAGPASGGEPMPAGHRYLRRVFDVEGGQRLKRAELFLTVDDAFTLYANGREVLSANDGWHNPRRVDLTQHLRNGRNVLAVEAENDTGPAGVLARLHVEQESGQSFDIVSDGQWKASEQEVPGWTGPGFDDSEWRPAKQIAPFGGGLWVDRLRPPRPAMRRHSLSQPIQFSMIDRRRYASGSNFTRPSCRARSFSVLGITRLIPRAANQSRMRRARYALSPASRRGRLRGRPTGCGTATRSITDSSRVDSRTWPAVTSTASGMPPPSVTRWNFVPNPPRLRPSAWSGGSSGCRRQLFCPRRRHTARRGRRGRRRTTGPSRSGRRGRAGPATLRVPGRTRRPYARR